MKKFLFLLLILGGAMYWGFSSGSELTKNVVHEPVRPHAVQKSLPKDTPPAEEKGILTEISDTVKTLVSGLSSAETQEGSIEARPPKPDAKSPVAHRNDPVGGGTGNPVLGNIRISIVRCLRGILLLMTASEKCAGRFPINLSGAFCCKKTGHRKSSVPGLIVP